MTNLDEQLEKQLTPIYGFKFKYRLRWRFDFVDGKTKYGIWDGASDLFKDKAAAVNKNGLLRASIEGEKIGEWTVKTLLEVDGHKYVSAEWLASASVGAFGNGSSTSPGTIVGLGFILDDKKVWIYKNGTGGSRMLTENDKKFKLLEHTAGS